MKTALLAAWISGIGCAEHGPIGPPPPQGTGLPASPSLAATASDTSSATATSDAAPAPAEDPRPHWTALVRADRWAEAAERIDLLPEPERKRAEVRYVRGRAALVTGDAAKARDLLAGLDAELPLLAADVKRHWADAAAEVGPHAEAAAFLGRSGRARDLVRAADAHARAGDAVAARKMADRAVRVADKSGSKSAGALARATRLRLSGASATSASGSADLRWIAVSAPFTPEAKDALEALTKAGTKLTAREATTRVEAFLDAARGEEALADVEGPVGKLIPAPMRLHLRAKALYKARRYADAAEAFAKAARSGTGHEAEERHDEARALARAFKDDEAIKKHRELARASKSTPWGERSAFQVAELLALSGKYDDAAKAYTAYLAAYPAGERRDDAEYGRALALLSGGSPKAARIALRKLADEAKRDEVSRMRELEGVAAMRAGDRDAALRLWQTAAQAMPLSWGAAMARARLAQAGATPPPPMAPAPQGTASPLQAPLPAVPALLASVGLDADAELFLAANEAEVSATYPGRESEALCSMYGQLSRAKRRYKVGSAAVAYTTLMRTPAPNERWTWECVYPRPYLDVVQSSERARQLPAGLVHAVMRQESTFDPQIQSIAGAVGLMQLIPPTAQRVAKELGEKTDNLDLSNPDLNVRFGAYYLSKLVTMFQGSVPLAVASYNAGPPIVSHWLEKAMDTDADVWVARIPYVETRNYVARVVGNWLRYQWIEGGNDKVGEIPVPLPAGARAPADAY